MRIHIHATAAEAAGAAAGHLIRAVRERPDAVLGLATGGTMEPVYDGLARAHADGLSFAGVRAFALDEYVGLTPEHPRSYHAYLTERFAVRVDLDAAFLHVPRGDLPPAQAAAEYDALLARHGPVDVQLLGLGRNGHIGFNEPFSSLGSRTREKALTRSTLDANAPHFGPGERPPRTAITMGIASILEARRAVMLATGTRKAEAAHAMIEGPLAAICPASALQLHPDATILLDADAAGQLAHRDRFQHID